MAMELDATGTIPANADHVDHNQPVLVAENTPPGTTTPPAGPQTIIQLEAGNVVHLPDGTDTSHPVQVGNDLEFVQPDGSVIVVPNGAVAGLTIYAGSVEIPPDAVAALFQANNITPAEGGQGAP